MKWLAAALLVTWLIHISYYAIVRHDTFDFLWTCNVACALLCAGLLLSWRRGVAIGTSWLAYGLPVWLIGLLSGNELVVTSFIIHIGGLAAGLFAFKKLGFPRGTWWRSTAALIILLAVSRLITPPEQNINLAVSVFRGWEGLFATWRGYFVFLLVTATLTFAIVEAVAIWRERARRAPPSRASARHGRPLIDEQ